MRIARLSLVLMLALTGCGDFGGPLHTPSHTATLASGGTIEVTSFNLVWGTEHDEHTLGGDCFALEYVSAFPHDAKRREAEAAEAFELVRPASEQWGLREATVAAIPALGHRGPYDLYWFRRRADGTWADGIAPRMASAQAI